jgi:hypothetical protein
MRNNELVNSFQLAWRRAKRKIFQLEPEHWNLKTLAWRTRHVPGEASFEAEASDQSRWYADTGRRRTGSFAGGKRIRIRSSDRRRSAISEHHAQSTLRSWRRGNGRRESCDILPLRQGKRHRRLHAGGARLRLRWMPWLWRRRWMSRLWRWRRMSRLWLQRLRLRRLRLGRRLGRLWFRRLLLNVGRLPFLLIRGAPCGASTSEDFLAGLGKVGLNCSALP